LREASCLQPVAREVWWSIRASGFQRLAPVFLVPVSRQRALAFRAQESQQPERAFRVLAFRQLAPGSKPLHPQQQRRY
jgi:hypothetical protein